MTGWKRENNNNNNNTNNKKNEEKKTIKNDTGGTTFGQKLTRYECVQSLIPFECHKAFGM